MIALFLVGLVGVLAFLAIPYRIFQAHKTGDAEIGDYAFIIFLVFLGIFTIVGLVYFQE
jgi:hypothetical protein